MRVLIAAADVRSAASIEVALAKENLICDTTDLGEDGVQISRLYDYDIILLDLMRENIGGYTMLRRLRAVRVHTPVLILSARGELDEKVKFFGVGADDFLTKPFECRELTSRILAIVRRSKGHSELTIRTGKLAVNLDTRAVSVDDQPVHLTPKEYSFLELLTLRKGTILAKDAFLNHLYGGKDEPESKILDVLVCKLRKKLARATGTSHYIETVWGHGYVLREPAEKPGAAPVASLEDRTTRREEAGTRCAQLPAAGQANRFCLPTAQLRGRIEQRPASRRNSARDHPVGRDRSPGIGLGTVLTQARPIEMRFEDAVATDDGPLRLPRPDPVYSLFGCATARCHE